MRIVDFILNFLGWLQIVAASTFVGFLISLSIYYFVGDKSLAIGIIITCIGLGVGVFWATLIWIRHGTIGWLSRIRRIS